MQTQGFIWAGIYVEDMQASIAFYRDGLGLILLNRGETWAHFDAGSGALLELMAGGKKSRAAKGPGQQPILLGLRVPDLEKAMAELQQNGVVFPEGIGEYANTRWAHFSDPEGNRLEIKEIP